MYLTFGAIYIKFKRVKFYRVKFEPVKLLNLVKNIYSERHLHSSLLSLKQNFIPSQLQNNRTMNRDPKHDLRNRLRHQEKVYLSNSLTLLATS